MQQQKKILKAENLKKPLEIHNGITTYDTGRGFSGINAWQPLGVVAGGSEEITVYVGNNYYDKCF
ncbi:MAG: hypothetical protein K2L10_03600 [Ruminococcus sp.]|nr:hypothetical protein [Ruminococcus sp.]